MRHARCLLAALLAGALSTAAAADEPACIAPGHWQVPGGAVIARVDALQAASRARVVLLGENHDEAAHHRWQLQTLQALHADWPDMAIALEMFPRGLQPALDEWVAGQLSEADFLQRTDWDKTWGVEAELYLPIFRFARDRGIPLRAVNVERSTARAVASGGWSALPAELAQSLGTPAKPPAAYVDDLRQSFDGHAAHIKDHKSGEADFQRFLDAQLLWDRAMAQGIAEQSRQRPVAALMGSGHIRFGHGVPHQLHDLGIGPVFTMIPWSEQEDCSEMAAGFADIVVLPSDRPSPHQAPQDAEPPVQRAQL